MGLNVILTRNKISIISTLYDIVTAGKQYTLVAWDFPTRIYKKTHDIVKNQLAEMGIESKDPMAPWPHVSLTLIENPSKEQRNKIKLAAPVYSSSMKVTGLEVLPGLKTPFSYITLKVDVGDDFKKFYNFLVDIMGEDKVNKPISWPEFKPHVSILTVDPDDHDKVMEYLPAIEDSIKRYNVSFTPKQIQLWDDFQISEIEDSILM
jgi:hypothetical protein